MSNNHSTTRPKTAFTALVLMGILSVGTGTTLMESASAEVKESTQLAVKPQLKGKPAGSRSNRLPAQIATAVRQDLSRQTGIPLGKLKVTSATPEQWPNGCLGLAKPDELCAQLLVEGWRVVVSDGSQTWVYRTDGTGQTLRLENQKTSNNLPKPIADAVLQDASRRLGGTTSGLRITEAIRKSWPDGCLGLNEPGTFCTQALVEGWLVVVEGRQQRLVYRTGETGSNIQLDTTASKISKLVKLKQSK